MIATFCSESGSFSKECSSIKIVEVKRKGKKDVKVAELTIPGPYTYNVALHLLSEVVEEKGE